MYAFIITKMNSLIETNSNQVRNKINTLHKYILKLRLPRKISTFSKSFIKS